MDDVLFTWYQALQLLALGPCLFVVFLLCVTARKASQVVVPILYFLSLACSFILPLLDVFPANDTVQGVLLMVQGLTPALSFLFIIQFLSCRIPTPLYWAILAVPLIGGSSIIYATMITQGEVCIYENLCTDVLVFKQLYNIFSGSLTFLLTVFVYDRMVVNVEGTAYQRQHKYALVLALIILNLALLAITLAQITGNVDAERGALADTIVRIGFIYLVLTSVFRVFAYPVEIDYERIPTIRPRAPSDRDLALADKVRTVLGQEKIYRMMELDREKFASKLAVSEHYLSHVINKCLGQSFSTLISHYRVLEAKERLAREDTAITVIGFEVGFSSIPSFNRVFKQTAGMSPSEYRSAQKAAPKK